VGLVIVVVVDFAGFKKVRLHRGEHYGESQVWE
jgi:hypothetical protein